MRSSTLLFAPLGSSECGIFRRSLSILIVQALLEFIAVSAQGDDNYLQPEYQQGGYSGGGYEAAAEPVYPPLPYSFGYDTVDEYGNKQFHKEESDSNNIKTGSYGYTDANGLYRRVHYVADSTGFHVTVTTNEPGTAPGRSANAIFNADPVVVPPVVGRASASGHVLSYAAAPAYLVQPAPYESLSQAQLGYPAYAFADGQYGRRKRNALKK
ncbi:uncharacterized protein LOC144123013 [Amblyomma americanum]|uniref:Cuticle protein n=1 Tax=Amblyomma americanum TaxID=6943 RepID=A0AAQ4EQE8_AMBAM